MLAIRMPQEEIYKLTIAMLICSVLTFDITKSIVETWKLALICCKTETPLVLHNYKAYMSLAKTLKKIPPILIQTVIDFAFPWLAPGIRASNDFNIILVDPPESRFIASKGLSNADHTCRYAQTVIALNKALDFFLSPHWLDFLASFVLTTTTINEIAICYLRMPLK